MTKEARKQALNELRELGREIDQRLRNIEDALNVEQGAFDLKTRFDYVANISVPDRVLKARIQTLKDALRVQESKVPVVRINWLRRHMQLIEGAKGMSVSLMIETSLLAKKEKRIEREAVAEATGLSVEQIAQDQKPFKVQAFYGNTALKTMQKSLRKSIGSGNHTHQIDVMGRNWKQSIAYFEDYPLNNGMTTDQVITQLMKLSDTEIGGRLYKYYVSNPGMQGAMFSAYFYSSDGDGNGMGTAQVWANILQALLGLTPGTNEFKEMEISVA